MKEQDLKEIWQSASQSQQITINMSQLVQQFKTGMERREQIVRSRDRKEIIGALLGVGIYGYIAFYVPFTLSRIGAVLIVVFYLFYIYKLRSNRKNLHTKRLFLPIQEQLMEQRQFMMNQAQLLDSVLYWMALPLFLSLVLFIWGIGDPSGYELPWFVSEIIPVTLRSKVIWTVGMAIILGYLVWMNKRAVVVNWKPLIRQIDNIIENLKKDSK